MTAGASALLVAIGGGAAGIAALTEKEPRIVTATGAGQSAALEPARTSEGAPGGASAGAAGAPPAADSRIGAGSADAPGAPPVGERVSARTSDQADRTGDRPPRPDAGASDAGAPDAGGVSDAGGAAAAAPAASAAPAPPAVTTRTVTEKRVIPYRTRLVRDPDLPRGRKRVQTQGVTGEETLRWRVTYRDGRPADRRLVDSTVTRQPQHRVVAFGTRRGHGGPDRCRPGSDHCFPVGRDAECPKETADAPPAQNGRAESDRTEGGRLNLLEQEFVLLTPEDLSKLELDPGLLC